MESLVLTGRIEGKRDRMTTDDLFEKLKRAIDKQLEERHNYKWDFTSSKEQGKLEHQDLQRLRTGHLEKEEKEEGEEEKKKKKKKKKKQKKKKRRRKKKKKEEKEEEKAEEEEKKKN